MSEGGQGGALAADGTYTSVSRGKSSPVTPDDLFIKQI